MIASLVSENPQDENIGRIVAIGVEETHHLKLSEKWPGTLINCQASLEDVAKALQREVVIEGDQSPIFYVSVSFKLDQGSKQVKQESQNITASLANISARPAQVSPAAAAAAAAQRAPLAAEGGTATGNFQPEARAAAPVVAAPPQ